MFSYLLITVNQVLIRKKSCLWGAMRVRLLVLVMQCLHQACTSFSSNGYHLGVMKAPRILPSTCFGVQSTFPCPRVTPRASEHQHSLPCPRVTERCPRPNPCLRNPPYCQLLWDPRFCLHMRVRSYHPCPLCLPLLPFTQ